ncbi:MAG: hypothetical protein E7523_08800 [Ruminococcaceae bacterium]|nr:hypothetical protein [Oscillospiraceae bacterium]
MDLNDLLSSLSDEDMKQLQETATQLLGNMQNNESASGNSSRMADLFGGNNPLADPKVLSGLSRYFGKMNEKDNRSDFLYALKPLLSETRRSKVDEAVNILRVLKMMRMLREGGLLG